MSIQNKGGKKRIWIDIKNSHEPLLFKSIMAAMPYKFKITARNYAEIVKLLEKYHYDAEIVGGHGGKRKLSKAIAIFLRDLELVIRTGGFDFALSHGSPYSIHVGWLKRKITISISDNDFLTISTKISVPFLDHLIIPTCMQSTIFQKMNQNMKIHKFDGFKEDIYIADYTPDLKFLETLPFKDFVTVRPEALKAEYVPKNARSIVPELLRNLEKNGYNILYLPRYPEDKAYAEGIKSIYIPPEPLNGLDIAYHSKAVLTGSGTLGREAACIGVPAVSFYPGEKLLSVDTEMINRGWLFHSRDPEEIVNYIMFSRRRETDLSRSKKVKQEVINIIEEIIEGD